MDIVGPLPLSGHGNHYIPVVCAYNGGENVAETLLVLFSRAGVPREILIDQGSNLHHNS